MRTSLSTTPVSSEPRTSPTWIVPDTALCTAALAIRASNVRPACVPTSAFSAPRKQASSPTSDQRATPSERRIMLERLPHGDLDDDFLPEPFLRAQRRIGGVWKQLRNRLRRIVQEQQWSPFRLVSVVGSVDPDWSERCGEPQAEAGRHANATRGHEFFPALPYLPGIAEQSEPHSLRE